VVTENVVFILKAWQEYLFLFLILILIVEKGSSNKKMFFLLLLLLFLSFYGIVSSIINGFGIQDSILGWRMYLLPILIPCLIYLNGGFKNIDNQIFYKYLKGLLFFIIIYALYQNAIFKHYDGQDVIFATDNFRQKGEYVLRKSLWFYEYFGSDHILPGWFNLVRDGKIRATSIFVSPIIFAQFLGVLGSFFMAKFTYSRKKFSTAILIVITLYGIYLTQVRAGLIFYLITFIIIYFDKKVKHDNYLILGLPLFLVVLTFFSLMFFKVGDASTIGRLGQYEELFRYFKIFGFGFGSGKSIIAYDSLIISVIFGLGIFSLIYFKIHLIVLNGIRQLNIQEKNQKTYLGIGLISCFSAYTYIIFFHFSLGSAPIKFIYFLTFYYLFQEHEERKN
tara:strand:+ start:84011 stop:85186 length:1176 start_codon:yes stop_codon:yes gene_type:complete